MSEPNAELNPRKVRIGLAIVCIVVAAAVALLVIIESPVGKAVMFAVAAIGFIRAFTLFRWLRRERG